MHTAAPTSCWSRVGDARQRIGLFIDHYNFQPPHQGVGGLVPADRFIRAAPDVLRTLKARVAAKPRTAPLRLLRFPGSLLMPPRARQPRQVCFPTLGWSGRGKQPWE